MEMDVFRMSMDVPHEDSNEVRKSSIGAMMVCWFMNWITKLLLNNNRMIIRCNK